MVNDKNVDGNINKKDIEEVADNLSTIFKIKCSIKAYREFDEKCKYYFGDSRHVMLSTCLRIWEELVPTLMKMEQKLELIHLLTERLLKLEDKVEGMTGSKKKKMNDGSVVK